MLDKLYGYSVLCFQQIKSVIDFMLFFFCERFHERLEIPAVCYYFTFLFHGGKDNKNSNIKQLFRDKIIKSHQNGKTRGDYPPPLFPSYEPRLFYDNPLRDNSSSAT